MEQTLAPLASVGMPVFNGARFLREAIDSVLRQDMQDLELIISDNGSQDETEQICRAVAATDARVRYYREESNRGAAWNFNRVVDLSRGTYFHWAASDDRFEPGYLTSCVRALSRHPDASIAFATTRVVGDDGVRTVKPTWRPAQGYATQERPSDRFRDVLWNATMCFEVFGVTRRDTLLRTARIGGFSSSDRVLLTELAMLGRFVHVDEPLYVNRVHDDDSMHAYTDTTDRARWFNPSSSVRFPRWRLLSAYVQTVWRAAPTTRERFAGFLTLLGWTIRQRRSLGYDILRVMPEPVSSWAAGAKSRRNRRMA